MLVCRHSGLLFLVHPAVQEKKVYHVGMEKIVLILIYDIFVTIL